MKSVYKLAAATFLLLTLGSFFLHGQSGRTYAIGLDWWGAGRGSVFPWQEQYDNASGELTVLNADGMLHPKGHPFFEALGSNGRACITCHQPAGAMSVASDRIRQRWLDTDGSDPIFAAIDGSNCPDLPQSDPKSHSLLLQRGLFRMVLPWPPKALSGEPIKPDFQLEVVRDPTGCNLSPRFGLHSAQPSVSVFRRPRVAANFKYAVGADPSFALMADGRETSLRSQAITAAVAHEQANTPLTSVQLDQIVAFEMQVFAAQSANSLGGLLHGDATPSLLGVEKLAEGAASLLNGAAEPRKPLQTGFQLWRSPATLDVGDSFRASVARGSDLFLSKSFHRTGDTSTATCATCHQSNDRGARAINIGTTNRDDPNQKGDLPLFRLTCNSGAVIYTEDPGRALITGKCADGGAIVMQQMRGLAARAPYFSNGSASTLRDVVDFYNLRFSIGYSQAEERDLINFLSVL